PALMRSWPSMIAFMPEPQTLLIVVQPAAGGSPAPSEAWRAGAWPRLAGSTQPMMTSPTSAAATPDCSSAALIAVAPSFGVGTPVNWPRKEPMAVRLAPAMTTLTSDMGVSANTNGAWRRGSNLPIIAADGAVRQTGGRHAHGTCNRLWPGRRCATLRFHRSHADR